MLEVIDSKYHKLIAYEEEKPKEKNFYAFMAKFAFFMVIFFNIFGTSLPFRERVLDVNELATSNSINQIVYTSMFLFALLGLIPKIKMLNAFILREKFLFAFLLWCILSALWSDYSFIVFKRWFQMMAEVLAITGALLYIKSERDILNYIKPVAAIYILFSFVSVFTIPGALDDYGVWRGAAASKNHLGQAALVCLLVWSFGLKNSSLPGKVFGIFIIAISTVLLFGSESSTALFAFFIITLVGFLFFIDKIFRKINAGRFLSFITIIAVLTFVVYAFIATPELVNSFLGNFGEDITFTGRTFLWEDVFNEAKKHIWLGTGYQSFWVITDDDILKLYQVYTWLPNQAHNGYIDIINEVGIIGSALFLLMVISFFINNRSHKNSLFWPFLVVAVLLINLQESTLFHNVLTGTMFIFSYLVVMMRKHDEEVQLQEADTESAGEYV